MPDELLGKPEKGVTVATKQGVPGKATSKSPEQFILEALEKALLQAGEARLISFGKKSTRSWLALFLPRQDHTPGRQNPS